MNHVISFVRIGLVRSLRHCVLCPGLYLDNTNQSNFAIHGQGLTEPGKQCWVDRCINGRWQETFRPSIGSADAKQLKAGRTYGVRLGCYAATRPWLGRVPGSTQGARGCCLLLLHCSWCFAPESPVGGLSRDANDRPRPPCGEAAPNCFNRHSLTEAGGFGQCNGGQRGVAYILGFRARFTGSVRYAQMAQ